MPSTTVYFASNRATTGPATEWPSYGAHIVAPTDPSQIRYAVAFVDGTDLNAEGSGGITAIESDRLGDFDDEVKGDIVGSGKNLLVFIHGFANSLKDGITRAAFNREWFAASGLPQADTTIIAFSWPSLGQRRFEPRTGVRFCSPTAWGILRSRQVSKAGSATATQRSNCSTRCFWPLPMNGSTASVFQRERGSVDFEISVAGSRSITASGT